MVNRVFSLQKGEEILEYARRIAALQETLKITMEADIGGFGVYDEASKDTILAGPAGRISNEMVGLKIPPGKGLIAQVENKKIPVALDSYIDSSNISHDSIVDSAVAREGIYSSAGAPIFKDGRIHGIIYAWRRNKKRFTKKDLSLLNQIGERFSKQHAEFEGLHQDGFCNEELIHHIDAFSGQNKDIQWCYEDLFLSVLDSTDLNRTIEKIASVLRHPTALFDVNKKIKAQSMDHFMNHDIDYSKDIDSVIDQLKSKDSTLVHFKEIGKYGILSPVRLGKDISSYLYVDGMSTPLSYRDKKLLLISNMVTGMHELRERVKEETYQKCQGEVISNLIRGHLNEPKVLIERCYRMGIDLLNKTYRLILIKDYNKKGNLIQADIKLAIPNCEKISEEAEDLYVVLVENEGQQESIETARKILEHLKSSDKKAELLAIVTDICRTLEDYSSRYTEACNFLDTIPKGEIPDRVISLEEIGPRIMFIQPKNQDYFLKYVVELFGALIEYDKKKNSDLMDTLIEYYQCGCMRKETAEKMYIHIHTLDYRLRRIKEISGLDIDNPQSRFNIQMAIEAYKALKLTGKKTGLC